VPWVGRKRRDNRVLVAGGHEQERVSAIDVVTQRPTEEHNAAVGEPVQECRVLVPAVLRASQAGWVPRWPVTVPD